MNMDALISLTNYEPESGILKPIGFAIDMALMVIYISLSIRTTLRLFSAKSDNSVLVSFHWLIYHLTEPFMSVVRKAFPKVDSFMVTLLPLLTVMTLYGADILLNQAFKLLDRHLVG